MPNIYGYFDLHQYLQDDYRQRKTGNPRYSLRAMGQKLGLNPATAIRIMSGKRNISANLLPLFISYLGLRTKEAEYFRNLVAFNREKTERGRMMAYQNLVTLRKGRTKKVDEERYAFYEQWYYSAVRELLRVRRFDGDYRSLAGMLDPPITVHQARRAVSLLEKLGFIYRDNNAWVVRDANITTGETWQGAAIHRFQQDGLSLAAGALDRVPRQERDFSTMTMCYSPQGFLKVRELLKRTREELTRIEEADGGKDRVYQVNFQLFPLSRPGKEGRQ